MPEEGITLKDNGVVHVEPQGLKRPQPAGHTRLHAKGTLMTIYPDKDETFVEVLVEEDPFESAKLYSLVMNYKTDQDQEQPTVITVRPKPDNIKDYNSEKVIYTTTFTVPNTNKQFQDLEPVPIDIPLGGLFQKTLVRISFPTPKGLFQVQHFEFVPPHANDSETEGTALWFQAWLDELKTKTAGILPTLANVDTAAMAAAATKVQEAVQAQSRAKGHGPQKEADDHTMKISDECLEVAMPILEGMNDTLQTLDLTNVELLQCLAIGNATPLRMADYCAQGDMQKERLLKLLKEDTELLKDMLVYGGPKKQLYGPALDIYFDIQEKKQQTEGKTILPKLALAVALELAYPVLHLSEENVFVKPVERYLHYETKYLEGELDPAFESLSVWELRMSINSNARDDVLDWSMQMMKSYRPDHVYTRQYTKINSTDVLYIHPEKDIDKLEYHNILSFGGLCGSRAKFGRLAIQTFGLPTWGLVIPGHATLLIWKPQGFSRNYGAGLWEGRRAYDFIHETVARKVMGDEEYYKLVEVLAAMSNMAKETPADTHPDPEWPWYTLSNLQRRRYGNVREPPAVIKEDLEIESSIAAMAAREEPESEDVFAEDGGTIVVPVFSRTSEEGATTWMKSYEGGMQLSVRDEGWVLEYKIPADLAPPESKAYNMICKLATVHDKDLAPLNVTINDTEHKVAVPYTTGLWQESEPVEVTLGGGGDDITIKVNRTMPFQPITMKSFKFVPV